jgi:serine protease Do
MSPSNSTSTSTNVRRAALAGAALAALVTIAPAGASGQDRGPNAGGDEPGALSAGFRKAAARARPAVVTVRGDSAVRGFGLPPNPQPFPGGPFIGQLPGRGPFEFDFAGVVVDAEKGHVLTSDQGVSGASNLVVIAADGRDRTVSQVRRDPRSGLALLVVDPKGLTRAEWGDSDALEPGDWVLALGRHAGLPPTVSAGVVSARGRATTTISADEWVLTDAQTTPGGPLVNLRGEVVGIGIAVAGAQGPPPVGRGGGFGFAVPAALAKRVAADLAREGAVRRAYLGVAIGPVDPADARRLDQPGAVAINDVSPESPAAKAGLKRGDVILKVQGKPLDGPAGLQAAVEFAPIGEPLTLTIDRGGERQDIEVRPAARPEAPAAAGDEQDRDRDRGPGRRGPAATERFPELGLRLNEVDPLLARRYQLRDLNRGLVVVAVLPESPADRGGLEPGMVITEVNDRRVESLADFRKAVADPDRDGNLIVRVRRGNRDEVRVIPSRGSKEDGSKDKDKEKDREKDKDKEKDRNDTGGS